MIVRSAILEGKVDEVDRASFDNYMATTVMAAIARYPGIRKVTLRKPAETEAGAPPVYMIFDLYFASLSDMHAALASPVRQDVRQQITAGMAPFKGRVYHLILEDIAEREMVS